MPYAADGQISQSPIDGGIAISESQYAEALEGMLDGKVVSVDGGFAVAFPPEHEPEVAPELSFEERRRAKLATLDAKRWEVEIGGSMLGATPIRTDTNSQAKIAAAYTMAKLDPSYAIPTWEITPGTFAALDNASIIALGDVVREHVQATFNHKAALHASIAAAVDQEELDGIDINVGW